MEEKYYSRSWMEEMKQQMLRVFKRCQFRSSMIEKILKWNLEYVKDKYIRNVDYFETTEKI